jgi:hypothetical protein
MTVWSLSFEAAAPSFSRGRRRGMTVWSLPFEAAAPSFSRGRHGRDRLRRRTGDG